MYNNNQFINDNTAAIEKIKIKIEKTCTAETDLVKKSKIKYIYYQK